MFVLKLNGPGETQELHLQGETIRIGRSESSDIRLADPKCSRDHCLIEPILGGGYRLSDPGSRNGTRVNGIEAAQVRLAAGDEIRIGNVRILFDRAAAPAQPVADSPKRSARRADRPHTTSRRLVAAVAAAILLLAVTGFLLLTSSTPTPAPSELSRAIAENSDRLSNSIGDSGNAATRDASDPAASEDEASKPASRGDREGRVEPRENIELIERIERIGRIERSVADRPPGAPDRPSRQVREAVSEDETTPRIVSHRPQPTEPLATEQLYLMLQDVDELAHAHEYQRALETLAEGIDRCADPLVLEDLQDRRLDLLARTTLFNTVVETLHDEVERNFRVAAGRVIEATEAGFELADGSRIAWASLAADEYCDLCEQLPLSPECRVALSTFCFDYEDLQPRAHRILEDLVIHDDSARALIDPLLSRKLGVAVPAGGFRVWNHRWMTPLRFDQMVRESRFHEMQADIIGGSFDERVVAYSALREMGAPGIDALREQLPRCHDDILMEIRSTSTYKDLFALRKDRLRMEALRERHLALVYDYERYPEVFRQPDAPKEDADAYRKTQREIEEIKGQLDRFWSSGERRVVRLPSRFRQQLRELHMCLTWFEEVGISANSVGESDFVEVLPDTWDRVSLRSFPLDADDIAWWEDAQAALAANHRSGLQAAPEEIEMVQVCNEYRMLLGRSAVRFDASLARAARGHSREMSALGYFEHDSPIPENQAPSDRARREGFMGDHVGENIARGRVGAEATHGLWFISPPHHRNLLREKWTHLGAGRAGEYWTANYGKQ